jgi:predicted GIY-YIG superfamily endonuclease
MAGQALSRPSRMVPGASEASRRAEFARNQGSGARYTAARRPVAVVDSERCHSVAAALARQRQLKRWTTAKQEALIAATS